MSQQIYKQTLNVSEIFYSIQGEGGQVGLPMIFVRLQGCKAKHACLASGVFCDTEFESGRTWTLQEILRYIQAKHGNCKEILWTGGEPLDQLTAEAVEYFRGKGFRQSLETSGLHPLPEGMNLDYITISPKVAEHVLAKNFTNQPVDELRYVRHAGQGLPKPTLNAKKFFVSPHSDGWEINGENLKAVINFILQNPGQNLPDQKHWRLSVQTHKIFRIL